MKARVLQESTLTYIQSAQLAWQYPQIKELQVIMAAAEIAALVLAEATPDHGVFGIYFTQEKVLTEEGKTDLLAYYTPVDFHVPESVSELTQMIAEVEREHVFGQNGILRRWSEFFIALDHLAVIGE